MNKIVKVISSIITEGRIKVKFLGSGKKDIQEKDQVSPFGIDSSPIKDMIAVYSVTSEIGNEVIVGYIQKNQISDIGETRLFSTNSEGTEQISLHLKNDGTAEFGGDSDFMVRFSVLQSEYNELRDSHNSLVNKWNAFALAYVPGSPSTIGLPPTASTASTSSGDISGAKIEEIKTS